MDVKGMFVQQCNLHGEAIRVFKSPFSIYAGAGQKPTPVPEGCIIMDLAGKYKPVVVSNLPIPGIPTVISVDWPDMGVPKLGLAEWTLIAKAIARTNRPLFIACMGGHGRTGTALAILGCLLGAIPKGTDPVDAVRKLYCDKAVETLGQCQYIAKLTGYEVTAKPSSGGGFSGGTSVGALCDLKVDGKWCNLDRGHDGQCDTRPRSEITKGNGGSKYFTQIVKAKEQPALPPSVTAGVTTAPCDSCGGRYGHFSNCKLA